MSVSRKENGSLVKKAGRALVDLALNRNSNKSIANSVVSNCLLDGIGNTNEKFRFGTDGQGNYGYIKEVEGADTFFPFKSELQETTLWTNPNPTSNMGTGVTININSGYDFSDYDFIKFEYKTTAGASTDERFSSLIIPYSDLVKSVGTNNTPCIALGGLGSYRMSRLIYYRSDTQLYVYGCTDTNGNLQNGGCIPLTIKGLK